MKILFLLLLFISSNSFSQNTTTYHGQELKVYPFNQSTTLQRNVYWSKGTKKERKKNSKGYSFNLREKKKEIFLPLGAVEDGTYLQYADLSLDYFQKKKKYKKHLNLHEDKLPYAIFQVKDNKLNGFAHFLSPKGDTIMSGFYKDNLRDGEWRLDVLNNEITTYKNGLRHGKSILVTIFRKHSYNGPGRTIREAIYDNDTLVSEVATYSGKRPQTVFKKELIKGEGPKRYEASSFEENIKEFTGFYEGERKVDNWKYFHSNGQISADIDYRNDTTYLGSAFFSWHSNVPDLNLGDFIYLYGISSTQSYFGNEVTLTGRSAAVSNGVHLGLADATYYFDNGQKHFSYKMVDDEFAPDTMFYRNGRPHYVMTKDYRTKEHVFEYFDKSGVKTDERRRAWDSEYKKGKSYMMYEGLKLKGDQYHNIFTFDKMPKYEDVETTEDTLVYTKLKFNNSYKKHEVYYLPSEKVRVEIDKQKSSTWGMYRNFVSETRQYFNDDYTECHVKRVISFDKGFKVFEEYDVVYSMNFYEAERKGIKLDGIMEKSKGGNTYALNSDYFSYSKPPYRVNQGKLEVEVKNFKTEYSFRGEPFQGKVKLKFDKNRSKFRVKKNKLIYYAYEKHSHLVRKHPKTYDGFGTPYLIDGLELIPNLFSEIPYFKNAPNIEIRKVKGQFENGQFQGDWTYLNSRNKKIIECTYKENKLTEDLTYHHFQKRIGRTRYRGYWGGGSGPQPRQYYVSMYLTTENLLKKDIRLFNVDGDTLAFMQFKNGLAARADFFNNKKGFITIGDAIGEQATYENGKLKYLKVEYRDEKKNNEYQFKNGYLDGTYTFRLDSGVFSNRKFTGIFAQNKGHGKIHREFVYNGIVLKENMTNSDNVLLSEIMYDTNKVRLNGSVRNTLQLSELVGHDDIRSDLSTFKPAVEGDFKSYYENGQVHATGILSTDNSEHKIGDWLYYNPDGQLMSKVNYKTIIDTLGTRAEAITKGDLLLYENGQLKSKAVIIDLMTKYNCASSDNYEVRQIAILEDYESGDTIPFPTRYHKTYYDMGVVQAEGDLIDGIPSGLWKFYDREGGLQSVGLYKDGLKQGRWLSGDLTGLGFIGDYCISPNNYEIKKKYLESNINLTIKYYLNGIVTKKNHFNAVLDK